MTVVVIGAGLAGLSAACHLTGRGFDVQVVEREPGPGGRAARWQRAGYTVDVGPTVLTMPDLIHRALAAVGADRSVLPLTRLDPAYRAVYDDGSQLRVRAGVEAMAEEIDAVCGPADAEAFASFATWLERLYRLEMPHFIERNFDRPTDLLSAPGALARLVAMGGFGRLGTLVRRRFQDDRLHRLFSFQAMYAGLAPAQALSIYAVITYLDCIEGVWAAPGGMHAVPQALAAAAARAGVGFAYDSEVAGILCDDRGVTGVELADGRRIRADAVVATGDLPVTYLRLLPELLAPRAVRRGRYSPSCVVWAVGARGTPPAGTAHHNIHFGRQWAESFEALIGRGELMPDPSRFVCVPSLSDPSLAPAGGSSVYVLEPAPNLQVGRVDWARARAPMRDRLEEFLVAQGYPASIEVEELITPVEWQARGLRHGTPFSLAHTFFQTGPFRPANREPRLPGMFFAGSGTVPGVGVPMVLISGELAAARVDSHLRGRAQARRRGSDGPVRAPDAV